MNKLNKLALSLTLSIISGAVVLLFSIWNVIDKFASAFLHAFLSCHPTVFTRSEAVGYILVNTGYAIIDGFIIGYLFAVLYNKFLSKFEKTAPADVSADNQKED